MFNLGPKILLKNRKMADKCIFISFFFATTATFFHILTTGFLLDHVCFVLLWAPGKSDDLCVKPGVRLLTCPAKIKEL